MSTNPKSQIIPFPLPPYLATFFSNQITTEPVLTKDGSKAKPFSVRRDSRFGEFLLRQLKKTNKPPVIKEGFTFFIEVSESQTNKNNSIADGRSSFLNFSDEDFTAITSVFKNLFDSLLIEHVSAFIDGVKTENPDKKRGVQLAAILNFCKKYGVLFSDTNLMAWKKMLQREFKKEKPNKIKVL
ncbi:hypothetical protein [Tenacibaculum soleae]|uniref:hypothetical protein n=1 Tax=Tenacibaculum soleae TaxID=447689 RepID=UPI002300C333|nr:hypothetical protein [Tenacibaculum soleae]